MAEDHGKVFYAPLERQLKRVLTPFDEFVHRQTTGGLFLMATTLAALVIANSSFADVYMDFLHVPIGLNVGEWTISYSLQHWINDSLMALFFFVVGLELKREILLGALADLRRAALPVIAALGGMIVPACIFYGFNSAGIESRGWAVPMATDIAFAVGVLALLGDRVPKALMTFLVALAIADDLGAVFVIAVFYTDHINLPAIAAAGGLTLMLLALNISGIRRIMPYFIISVPLWYALLMSGIHPTLAGVIGAFTVPARPKYDPVFFSEYSRSLIGKFDESLRENPDIVSNETLRGTVHSIERATHKVIAPLQWLEHIWHMPVAFLVIPLFAFANAGIKIDSSILLEHLNSPVFQGVLVGLLLGKFAGIVAFCWLGLRLQVASLPESTTFRHISGVALLAGIGFTMSIFIAQLAYPDNADLILAAKMGIFTASSLAGLGGYIWLRLVSREQQTV